MDKVITTNSQTITITRHLPYAELGVTSLDSCGNRTTSTVDGVEAVGVQIVRHAARAADTGDDNGLMGRYTHLSHGLLQCHTDSMVTTARAKLYILIAFKLTCFHINIIILKRPRMLMGAQVVDLVFLYKSFVVLINRCYDPIYRKWLRGHLVVLLQRNTRYLAS